MRECYEAIISNQFVGFFVCLFALFWVFGWLVLVLFFVFLFISILKINTLKIHQIQISV